MSASDTYSVVIADDVAALRNLIRIGLERSGRFTVVGEAQTGREAISAAAQHRPQLMVLDLSMPEMDGLEALPRILEASPATRVAVLSGFNHVRMGPVALRMGASAYLEKGLAATRLVEELLRVLEPKLPSAPPDRDGATASEPRSGLGSTTGPHAAPAMGHLRILLLLKNGAFAKKFQKALDHATGRAFVLQRQEKIGDAEGSIRGGNFDLIVADAVHTADDADKGLVDLLTAASNTPVVLVLPKGADPHLANKALKLGVEDCLPQDKLDPQLALRSLLYAVERRRAHDAIRLARDGARDIARFQEIERIKTQFFNTAAHELGTPLTPIRLQLHILKTAQPGTLLTEQHAKSIAILDRNVERLTRLTHDLLDVARLQSGKITLQRRATDIGPVLREVIESFEPVAVAQGVHLELSPVPSSVVDIDAKRITQVLYNLVSNALKFTHADGRVWIDTVQRDQELEIRVHDSGEGLTAAQIERLFQPFSQVNASPERNQQGTGLGLYVSRGIVDLHGGRIWCESPGLGRGATFKLAFPTTRVNARATVQQDEPLLHRRQPSPPLTTR